MNRPRKPTRPGSFRKPEPAPPESPPKKGGVRTALAWLFALAAAGVLAAGGAVYWPKLRDMMSRDTAALSRSPDETSKPVSFDGPASFLLITVDSIRPEYLGCYGAERNVTPRIDALAESGVLFEEAVTSVPITRPSHATILTGLYPPRHGVRDDGVFRLSDSQSTLAETLKAAGYDTAAFVGSFLLDRRFGLNQGFDTYDDRMVPWRKPTMGLYPYPDRSATDVVDAALDWFSTRGESAASRPCFAWVHFADLQSRVKPPEPFRSQHEDSPYLCKLAYVDSEIGRLLDGLENKSSRAAAGPVITCLVGSHGEAFGEHSEEGHGLTLYESTVAVPLIWHGGGSELVGRPRTVRNRLGGTVDVVPTVLELLHVPGRAPFDGVHVLGASHVVNRGIYMETMAPRLRHGWFPVAGVRRLTDKILLDDRVEILSLPESLLGSQNPFDAADPSSNAFLAVLQNQLAAIGKQTYEAPLDTRPFEPAMQRLAGMGYETGQAVPRPTPPPEQALLREQQLQFATVLYMLAIGQYPKVAELTGPMIAATPENAQAWAAVAQAMLRHGNLDAAIHASMQAVRAEPRAEHWITLAEAFFAKNDLAACELALEQMKSLDPRHGGIEILRGSRAVKDADLTQAKNHFGNALRIDPYRYSGGAYAYLGTLHAQQGDLASAAMSYEKALEAEPGNVVALLGQADLAFKRGNMMEEEEKLRRVVALRPVAIEYANRLSRLLIKLERNEEAVEVMRQYQRNNPADIAGLGNLGNALMETGNLDEAMKVYREALALAPQYTVARINLAWALTKAGDVEGAIREYHEAIKINPAQPLAYSRLIQVLVEHGRIDEALEVVERAAEHSAVDWEEMSFDEELAPLTGDLRFQMLRERHQNQE